MGRKKMMSASTKQIVLIVAVGLLAVAGCRRPTAVAPGHTVPSAGQAPAYVKCIGEFSEHEENYPWFENWVEEDGTEVNGDGRSPRAVFKLSAPAEYADRTVGILYTYSGDDLPQSPALSEKGQEFSFDVPEDFLAGEYGTIENIHIRDFRAMPTESP